MSPKCNGRRIGANRVTNPSGREGIKPCANRPWRDPYEPCSGLCPRAFRRNRQRQPKIHVHRLKCFRLRPACDVVVQAPSRWCWADRAASVAQFGGIAPANNPIAAIPMLPSTPPSLALKAEVCGCLERITIKEDRGDECIAMDAAGAETVAPPQAGDHAQHLGLRAVFHFGLKAHDVYSGASLAQPRRSCTHGRFDIGLVRIESGPGFIGPWRRVSRRIRPSPRSTGTHRNSPQFHFGQIGFQRIATGINKGLMSSRRVMGPVKI